MGWLSQLIGAGRGDESPAADAAYRKADAQKKGIDRAKTVKIHQQQYAETREAQQQEDNGPGNGIINGF